MESSTTKRCPRCRERLNRANFARASGRADGLAAYCKPCAAARERERYRRNVERHDGATMRPSVQVQSDAP